MWESLTHFAAWMGWFSGGLAFGLSLANMFRLNRVDAAGIAECVDDATYELEKRVATLEADAGIGTEGSWTDGLRKRH